MGVVRRGMLSIGEFADASRLSRKALRIYERENILSPAHIDPVSGYRYYRPDQLARARLVRMLRQTEMPLATIGEVLALLAYDAAVHWIAKHGYESAGSPREVWLSEPDEVLEMTVIWPFRDPR